MPIKLPRGLRRKSSGNVLDELQTPSEGSFRVIDRHPAAIKSFDGVHALRSQFEPDAGRQVRDGYENGGSSLGQPTTQPIDW